VEGDHAAPAATDSSFAERVAPILEAKCVSCHRPENRKGGFDLTSRASAIKGGELGAGLVPGKPEESPIYTRSIAQAGQRPEMPAKGEPLTEKEAAALKSWIAAGASWPDALVLKEKAKADGTFWSFQPVAKIDPPVVTTAPAAWQVNPIDRFIWHKLAEKTLQPNPAASPRMFIRRATYDLLGLPPTPEEVAAFETECRELGNAQDLLPTAAVEKLISRLLERPQYGERWGRHWLDVVRFGESRGYERNEIITNLWPFRDYIIRSFNADKPFNQLVLEHLAGDVIGKDQPEVEIGSAFLVAGPYDDVGNQDPVAAAQIRADQMDEMIRATTEAFLGLTMGCARCHDHKFDPLLQKDYYALFATFAGTVHGPREVSTAQAREERLAKLKPLQEERKKLAAEKDEFEKQRSQRESAKSAELAKQWTRPRISRYGTEEVFEPVDAKYVRLTVDGTDSADAKQTQFKLDEFEVWTAEATARNVALAEQGATAMGAARDAKDFAAAYSAALTNDGKFGERWHSAGKDLVITLPKVERIQRVYFSSDRTKALGEDHHLTVFAGDYNLEVSLDGKEWRQVASSADRQPPSVLRRNARITQFVSTEADRVREQELKAALAQVDAAIGKIPPLPTWWVGTHRAFNGPQAIYLGGNPQRKGELVPPASLQVLSAFASAYRLEPKADEGARRVALANWLTATDHPLTSRVLANRVWQYHFGAGIVDTPSDFGYMGNRPSHPELLDWLAGEVLQGGWKLKPLHRLIMTSQAYRQSGTWQESAARVDAESRLLWRFPPRRLDAEEVRDTLLQVAGKLDFTMGGPGFRLYDYQQDNVATYVPLDKHGPETYRRAVYHHNARSMRVDVLTDFDCPDPSFAEPRRAATTTPLQALTLMNHQFSLDMTHFLAERLQAERQGTSGQVQRAFQLCYARDPTEPELSAGMKLIEQHGIKAFCRAIFNSNELIHLN
jgi:mono/diheme cytochrome c family protein